MSSLEPRLAPSSRAASRGRSGAMVAASPSRDDAINAVAPTSTFSTSARRKSRRASSRRSRRCAAPVPARRRTTSPPLGQQAFKKRRRSRCSGSTCRAARRTVGGVFGERVEWVLALAAHAQGRPAGDQQPQPLGLGEQLAEGGCGREQVLEIVDQEQQLLVAEVVRQLVAGADRLRDLLDDQARVGERRERHPEDAVLVGADQLGGHLERQPRLARPARPGDRDQARAVPQQLSTSSTSRSRPSSGVAATGRLVASSVLSGGKSSWPSW